MSAPEQTTQLTSDPTGDPTGDPTVDPATEPPPLGLHAVAGADPGRVALVDPDGREVTFGALGETAHRLANALRELGIGRGDAVACVVHNAAEYYELVMATGQIGVRLVPVNVNLTAGEAGYIVADCGAEVLVAHADLAARLAPCGDLLPRHRYAIGASGSAVGAGVDGWSDYATWRDAGAAAPPGDRVAGAIMGYTSGTTGRPKGVRRDIPELSPEVLASFYEPLLAPLGLRAGRGVHLVCAPLYHAAPGNISSQLMHLGHTVVILRRFDAEDVLRAIARYRVTSTQLVPTHVHRILRLPAEVRARHDVSSMTNLLVAGAPFPQQAKRELIDWLGPVVWEYLASTEGMVSMASSADALSHPGTVGRPVVEVRILDAEGRALPPGEVGAIHFATMARFDYLNDPAKTAAAYDADGFATVGDLGWLDDDGFLYLADRRDDVIISGGVNIYPSEVEQRLIEHPAVADVAAVGASDPEWGRTVVAVVELEPGWTPGDDLAAELDGHARGGLAGLKCPRRYEFRDSLPRTPTGKLLRRTLRESLEP